VPVPLGLRHFAPKLLRLGSLAVAADRFLRNVVLFGEAFGGCRVDTLSTLLELVCARSALRLLRPVVSPPAQDAPLIRREVASAKRARCPPARVPVRREA
jgi:hypothetical protein